MLKSKILRIICIILGFICLGIGVLGIILPILPTTPFLLLTSFFFVKGSKRFNDWFLSSKIYKKYLENFSKNKVMTIYGELILLSFVSLMIIMTMFIVNNLTVSIILMILVILKYTYFIFKIKTVDKKTYLKLRKNIDIEKEKLSKNKVVIDEE